MILDRIIGANVKKAMSTRKDGSPQLDFFDIEGSGVSRRPFSFLSGKNRLYGHIHYVGPGPYKALVVFFHGFGAGHQSYNREIGTLAKAGYLVYAYDCTGCYSSEGTGVISLAQSLFDQQAFFAYLDSLPEVASMPRYVIGHSWGGFTAFGALKKEYNVSKCVSIAGFLRIVDAMETAGPSFLKKYRKATLKFLRREYGAYGAMDAVDMVNGASAKVLYIQGNKDAVCPFKDCFLRLQKECHNPNLTMLEVKNLYHQPYWTEDSQAYYLELTEKYKIFTRDRDLSYQVDYRRLNQDNPKILKAIIDFFDA